MLVKYPISPANSLSVGKTLNNKVLTISNLVASRPSLASSGEHSSTKASQHASGNIDGVLNEIVLQLSSGRSMH